MCHSRASTTQLTPLRLDGDAEPGRRDTGRDSEFDIEIGGAGNETTFVIAPQIQSSPIRPPELDDPGPDEDGAEEGAEGGYDGLGDGQDDLDDGEEDLAEENVDETQAIETQILAEAATATVNRGKKTKRGIKYSKHGIACPSLPPAVVKRLAQTFAKTSGVKGKISADALNAIMQASDWFFEQLGDDLHAYAEHAGRKTINESDMLVLMRRCVTKLVWVSHLALKHLYLTHPRQRQIGSSTTMFSLAQRHLPRELLQELRMPPPPKSTGKHGQRRRTGLEQDSEIT
jgi:histone H3/H4